LKVWTGLTNIFDTKSKIQTEEEDRVKV